MENNIQELLERIECLEQKIAKLEVGIPAYFNATEAGRYICSSAWTVRDLAKSGEIAFSRIGVGPKASYIFARADLDEFLRKRSRKPYVSRSKIRRY